MMWPGALDTWPTDNWRLCNGAALNRTTYAELFGIISTTYGIGDGTTTFNLPDLRDKSIFGVGNSPFGAVGNTGGSKNAVVVSHNHSITDPGHSHTSNRGLEDPNPPSGSDITQGAGNRTHKTIAPNTTIVNSNTTGITATNNEGVAGTDKNLPPYMALYYIIRIK